MNFQVVFLIMAMIIGPLKAQDQRFQTIGENFPLPPFETGPPLKTFGHMPPPPPGKPPPGRPSPGMGPVPKPPIDENDVNVVLVDGSGMWQNNYNTLAASVISMMQRGDCRQRMDPRPPPGTIAGQCPESGGKCDNSTRKILSVYMDKEMEANGEMGRLVITNGIPDHCYQVEASTPNPNDACEYYSAMWLPLKPSYSGNFTAWPLGPVGIAKSGAYFYNHVSGEPQCNVAALLEKPTFDPCDGHSDPLCRYHYHKAPVCIEGWESCGLMGYMIDGVPVYGKCSLRMGSGKTITLASGYSLTNGSGCDASHYTYNKNTGNLDEANGFYFDEDAEGDETYFKKGDYAYFFTPEYPFIMPGSMVDYRYGFCRFYPSDLKN